MRMDDGGWISKDLEGDIRFHTFMLLFKKNYKDIAEYNIHKGNFIQNFKKIAAHNKKYENG